MAGGVGRAAVFAPLEPAGRAELVERRLFDAIAVGLLRDGEQLPSESDLAEHLGVATVTVREALTALRRQHLLETRRGRGGGSFVRAPADPAATLLRARLLELGPGDLRDLGDHYAAISGTAARLAADRADDDDVARVRSLALELLGPLDGAGARRRAEGQFHVEVVAAAQSPRLTREEIRLQAEVGPLLWLPAGPEDAALAADEHLEIVEAIASGRSDAARTAAETHVGLALRRVLALRTRLSHA